MGTFPGHIIPGSFFIVIGLWWAIQTLRHYFNCRRKQELFTSSATYKLKCFPVEPSFKLACMIAGLIIERENMQHITMYVFYGLTAVVDLLVFCKCHLPKNLDYIALLLAVSMEGLLFKHHLYGRSQLDILLHTLLLYTIMALCLSVLLEMKFQDSLAAALCRSYFIIVHGTWFFQIGFILYNPNVQPWNMWNVHSKQSLMKAAVVFTWHCGGVFVAMLILYGALWMIYRKKSSYILYKPLEMNDITDIEPY